MGSVIGTAVNGVGSLVGHFVSSPFNGVACEYVRSFVSRQPRAVYHYTVVCPCALLKLFFF